MSSHEMRTRIIPIQRITSSGKVTLEDLYGPASLYDVPLPRYVKATHCRVCHKVTSMTFTDGKEHDPHTDNRLSWIPWCECAKKTDEAGVNNEVD